MSSPLGLHPDDPAIRKIQRLGKSSQRGDFTKRIRLGPIDRPDVAARGRGECFSREAQGPSPFPDEFSLCRHAAHAWPRRRFACVGTIARLPLTGR